MTNQLKRLAASSVFVASVASVLATLPTGAQSPPGQQRNQPVVRKAPPAQVARPQPVVRQQVPKVVRTAPPQQRSQPPQVVRRPPPVVSQPSRVSVPQVVKTQPPKIVTTPSGGGSGSGQGQSKIAVPKNSPVTLPGKVTPSKIVTPSPTQLPGKIVNPGQPGKVVPGKVTLPGPGIPPGKVVPPQKLTQPTVPVIQGPGAQKIVLPKLPPKSPPPIWAGKVAQPAPGLPKILQFKPVKPGLPLSLMPKLPPVPPKKWGGPSFGYIPPKMAWHPFAGKRVYPYFFVGFVGAVAASSYAYSYWSPPPPSCYAGGSAVYYYPGTRRCFDFSVAAADDPFECHGRVFRWQPTRYRTVETLIAETADSSEVAEGWVEREPTRRVVVEAGIKRATERAQTVAKIPIEKLDCSACLAALGPTEGENGLATVSLVNNCEHDVTVAGGLTLVDAPAGQAPLCDFVGDIPSGGEVAACTKPVAELAEAQLFLNAVTPVAGTDKASPACRIPEQRAEAPTAQ